MNTHDKIHKLLSDGIIIYPVVSKHKPYKFAVCIEDEYNTIYKKRKTSGEYKHTSSTINKALNETINYLSKKLLTC